MHKLQTLLNDSVHGATFIALNTETDVPLKGGKANPLQGRVRKTCIGSNVMVFQNARSNAYENMVKRRLEKEGKNPETFVLSPRKWGNRIPNTPFVEHNGKLYLEVIFMKAGESKYYVDGVETDKDRIPGLDDKQEGEQGGLDNKVIIRTYSVDSIRAITIDHQVHNL